MSFLWLGVVGLILLFAAGLFFGARYGGKQEEALEKAKIPAFPVVSLPEEADHLTLLDDDLDGKQIPKDVPKSAEGLMSSFLQQGDWSSKAVYEFQKSWERLSLMERQQVISASWFIDFGETLKIYLEAQKEREARYGGEVDYSHLTELAGHLGIMIKEESAEKGQREVKATTPKVRDLPIIEREKEKKKAAVSSGHKQGAEGQEAVSTAGFVQDGLAVSGDQGTASAFKWDRPVIKEVGAGRFVVIVFFLATEEEVFVLVQENADLNLQPFRVDLAGHEYTIQKEFRQREEAGQFSAKLVEIFANL